jgi:hypothetical protein
MDYKFEITSTGKLTYWPPDPNKLPDLIDYCVIKNVSANYIKIEEGYYGILQMSILKRKPKET